MGLSASKHYNSEPDRKPVYDRLVANFEIPAGFAIEEGAALHFVNGVPAFAVSAERNATVLSVAPGVERTVKETLNVEHIDVR